MMHHLEGQAQRTHLMPRTKTAGSPAQLDQTLKQIVEGIKAAVGVDHCGVFLLNSEGKLMNQAGEGDLIRERCQGQWPGPMSPAVHAFFHKVMDGQKPAICYDAQSDARADREAARQLGIRSVLGVPMETAGRQWGVVLVATFDEAHAFTAQEIELVQGVAHLLALTLDNARLYDEVQQQQSRFRAPGVLSSD